MISNFISSFHKSVSGLAFIILFVSCDKNKIIPSVVKEQVVGCVQKGPYVQGTPVTMFELSSELKQTGKSFITNTSDNKGVFQFNRIALSSPFVLISASGYYFNEKKGILSSSTLELNAIIDIRNVNSINVNILTHLEIPRILYLVEQGMEFAEAKRIAQKEIFSMLDFNGSVVEFSENFDISQVGEGNAMLLAASVIVQGDLPVAELTQFLSELALDLEKDGYLSNEKSINLLKANALDLQLPIIRSNLVNRYSQLGDSPTIPRFEEFVFSFLRSFISLPLLSTPDVQQIFASEALVGGYQVISTAVLQETGIVYGTKSNPVIESDLTVPFLNGNMNTVYCQYYPCPISNQVPIANLLPQTKYFARFYATNILGTSYGKQIEFITKSNYLNPSLPYGSITDIEGNLYATVSIGTQIWMAENLRTSRYSNGDYISNIQPDAWGNSNIGSYASYGNEPADKPNYGKLYNGYAIIDPRGLCPSGWRVPTEADWDDLINFLGGSNVAAPKLSSGLWFPAIPNASNSSGFSGLAGGDIYGNKQLRGLFLNGGWWSSTQIQFDNYFPPTWGLKVFFMTGGDENVRVTPSFKMNGWSVRCLKN